jgi:hypothetical protein
MSHHRAFLVGVGIASLVVHTIAFAVGFVSCVRFTGGNPRMEG